MSDPDADHAEHGGASFDALGVDFRRLERRGELVNADVLDAWYPPSPRVLATLEAHLDWIARTSPPAQADGLVRTIAEVRGLDPATVLAGGGSSELIYLALPRLIDHRHGVCVPRPSYGEYAHLVRRVLRLPLLEPDLPESDGFRPELESLAAAAGADGLLVLVNPNSPTGAHLEPAAILELLDRLPSGTLLLVDETYTDFVDPDRGAVTSSVERHVSRDARLLVLKSMSKWYALSGLRVGYLAAHPTVVAGLRRWMPPWAVGLAAQVAAVEALRDEAYYCGRARQTRELRESLARDLGAIRGVGVVPGVANFLLLGLDQGGPNAAAVVERAAAQGVHLRDCRALFGDGSRSWLRTAVKDAAGNARIVSAIAAAVTG